MIRPPFCSNPPPPGLQPLFVKRLVVWGVAKATINIGTHRAQLQGFEMGGVRRGGVGPQPSDPAAGLLLRDVEGTRELLLRCLATSARVVWELWHLDKGAMHGPKSHDCLKFGDIHCPKPSSFTWVGGPMNLEGLVTHLGPKHMH